jgi:hypothetical protein
MATRCSDEAPAAGLLRAEAVADVRDARPFEDVDLLHAAARERLVVKEPDAVAEDDWDEMQLDLV